MKKILLFVCLLCVGISVIADTTSRTIVYKVDIKEEIGPAVWRLTKKSFQEAQKAPADYILIHMNTYGGMVVYADSLRSLIQHAEKPVWVFIDNNAASAGALISIACDKIYMREGANIGAATVVNQTGEAMPDKYQSYMRSMIRSTAQAHGKDTVVNKQNTIIRWKRDPLIAEAMVDERIRIEGITDSGRIVTFTPHEAMKYGYCDGIAENVEEVMEKEGVSGYTIQSYKKTTLDKIIGFLINPMLQGLLIMAIVGGIYFELQTPGVGFPLMAAITACLLYFAPLYLEGLATHWELVFFILGIVLLLLEILVIPGFGVAGISGIVLIVGALVMAGVDEVSFKFLDDFVRLIVKSLFLVISCSLIGLGISIWLGGKIFGSRHLAFALHARERASEGFIGVDMSLGNLVGREGVTVTDLRPAGKVKVGDEIYDAIALFGDYIPRDTKVGIKKHQSGQVYVLTCE